MVLGLTLELSHDEGKCVLTSHFSEACSLAAPSSLDAGGNQRERQCSGLVQWVVLGPCSKAHGLFSKHMPSNLTQRFSFYI